MAKRVPAYMHNDQTKKQTLAHMQAPDWSRNDLGVSWVDGKRVRHTLRANASVVNEMSRRQESTAAKLLGSYRTRKEAAFPASSRTRAGAKLISEYRPVYTRKRMYAVPGALALAGGAAIKHRHSTSAFGVDHGAAGGS